MAVTVSPLAEDDVLEIYQDMDGFAITMSKLKRSALAAKYGWDDTEKNKKDVPFDLDMSSIELEGHEQREIDEAWKMIEQCMDFMRIDMSHIDSFINEYIDEENDPDYELFLKYTHGSLVSRAEYVQEYVRDVLMDEGTIEDIACEYGEPGYTKAADDNVIVTANWNNVPGAIVDIMCDCGYDIEWSDEWSMDYDANKIYRVSPDSWGWEPSYFIAYECELLGIYDNEEFFVETMAENQTMFIPSDMDLEKYEYVNIDEVCYQNGWYGRNDDAEKIREKAREKFRYVLLQTCSVGQFAHDWSIWGKGEVDE